MSYKKVKLEMLAKVIVSVTFVLMLALFVYSFLFKFLYFKAYQSYMTHLFSDRAIGKLTMFFVPTAELVVSILLLYPNQLVRKWGMYLTFLTFFIFTLLNIYLFFIMKVCTCKSTEWDTTWEQNNILTISGVILSLIAIAFEKRYRPLAPDKGKPGNS